MSVFGYVQWAFTRPKYALYTVEARLFEWKLIVDIPYQQLSEGALRALIEEFVTRDGTDYGVQETSLETKIQQVEGRLRNGLAVVVFDSLSESCDIVLRDK